MAFCEWLASKVRQVLSEESSNMLVPITGSNFQRDQPILRSWSTASPDHFAQLLIFVTMTPRSSLLEVWRTFPVIVGILQTHFNDRNVDVKGKGKPLEAQELKDKFLKMSVNITPELKAGKGPHRKPGATDMDFSKISPRNIGNYRDVLRWANPPGYSVQAAVFLHKWTGIATIWSRRNSIFAGAKQFLGSKADGSDSDPVEMVNYLVSEDGAGIPNMDIVKAGFVTQICMGKLGCIDVHNYNIYRSYITNKYKGSEQGKYLRLIDPYQQDFVTHDVTSKSTRIRKILKYKQAIDWLDSQGFSSAKLWDMWTNYVANLWTSTNPKMNYAYNPSLGFGVDPTSKELDKLMNFRVDPEDATNTQLRPNYPVTGTDLPDPRKPSRMLGAERQRQVSGRLRTPGEPNPSSRSVGLAHRLDRNSPEIISRAALSLAQDPSEKRFRQISSEDDPLSPVAIPAWRLAKDPHKLLYWINRDPEMAEKLGLTSDERKQIKQILQSRGLA